METRGEVDFIKMFRKSAVLLNDYTWVGGYKHLQSAWYWEGGELDSPILYSNWGHDQPDNFGGYQYCLSLFPSNGDYSFDDGHCGELMSYICEK